MTKPLVTPRPSAERTKRLPDAASFPSSAEPLPGIRKIAVLRANALGDFIFVLPALQALRTAYPDAEIVYLGKPWHQQFAPGRVPDIDRVAAVPPYPGVGAPEGSASDPAALDDFFRDMQAEHFDLAFQMHGGGGNSNPFLLRLGAKRTVGLRAPDAPALDVNIPYVFYQNEVLRLLEVVACAGARTDQIEPRLTVLESDHAAARQILKKYSAGKYIIIHPGASDPRRHWPAANFAAVAGHFIERGYQVFVTGTGAEKQVVQDVVDGSDGRAVSLYDALDFSQLAGLHASASLVVSNDTGPLHLAGAAGSKSVGIYWIGNLITAGHITRTRHRPLVSWTTACPRCGISCVSSGYPFDASACRHDVSFVDDVRVDHVLRCCEELLAQGLPDASCP